MVSKPPDQTKVCSPPHPTHRTFYHQSLRFQSWEQGIQFLPSRSLDQISGLAEPCLLKRKCSISREIGVRFCGFHGVMVKVVDS